MESTLLLKKGKGTITCLSIFRAFLQVGNLFCNLTLIAYTQEIVTSSSITIQEQQQLLCLKGLLKLKVFNSSSQQLPISFALRMLLSEFLLIKLICKRIALIVLVHLIRNHWYRHVIYLPCKSSCKCRTIKCSKRLLIRQVE